MFALKSSLLCLLTTHDAAGSGQIGIAKMKEHQKMSRLVPRSQAKQRVVKLKAAMRMDTPFVRTLWHDKKTRRCAPAYIHEGAEGAQ